MNENVDEEKTRLRADTENFTPGDINTNFNNMFGNQMFDPYQQNQQWGNNMQFNPFQFNMFGGFGQDMFFNQTQMHQFQNEFPKLTNYTNINVVRNKFPSMAMINIDSFDPKKVTETSKFFMIRSSTFDDIHKSMKYGVWASTKNNNQKLDENWQETQNADPKGKVFLFFRTVNMNTLCGVAV